MYKPGTREIRGWQVRFATSLSVPAKSNKAFMVSTSGGSEKALALAIAYRDKIISEMFEREGLVGVRKEAH